MSTFRQKVQATTNWVKPDPEDLVEAPRPSRRARKRPGAPVTAHRLFPAFVTVWFAALFGLGSFAVPSSLLGALVKATGLPALVPAAAPPLGFTAHLLVAFMLTGFGAALGLALVLRLSPRSADEVRPVETAAPAAQPEAEDVYKVRARDAHPDAPPRRPLVLTEAFADPLIAEIEPAEQPLLRKPSLPASEQASEPVTDAGPWIPEFTPGGAGAVRPLDLSALDLPPFELADLGAVPVEQPASAQPEVAALETVEASAEPEPEPEAELAAQAVEAPAAPPALIAATPQLPASFAAALPDVSDGTWSPVAGAPLESLGLVQLIERLALAIAAQKASNAAIVDAEPAATASPEAEVLSAEPEVALEPEPQPEPQPEPEIEPAFAPGPFSQPQMAAIALEAESSGDVPAVGSAREAILRRLGAIAAGDLTEAPGSMAAAAPSFSRPASVSSDTPVDAVVSLRPSAPPFAPPAVTSSSATAAPLETDAALRSALATLQRMTVRG